MSDSTISTSQLQHIAKLSRIPLTDDDSAIASQLSQAALYSTILNELDTQNVEPTFQVNHKTSVLRQDIVTQSLDQKVAISQAAKSTNGYIVTAATIKK